MAKNRDYKPEDILFPAQAIITNDLVKEMNLESAARIQQSVHEIEMLKKMYELKITRNN